MKSVEQGAGKKASLLSRRWRIAAGFVCAGFVGSWLFGANFPAGSAPIFLLELLRVGLLAAFVFATYWELKRSAEGIQQQRDSMIGASKFTELGEMAAGMAHEINTPLGAITLSASQLRDLLPEKFEHRDIALEIVDDILSSSEKISRIVRGLKNLSRDSSKDLDFVFCDLPELIQESLALCEASLRAKKIELRASNLPANLDIQCNPSQVSQVLLNLVNNARDAVELLDERWIQISLTSKSNQVELRITDSGAGLSPEVREKLFQPFFTTKEVGKGTGMGLSIVFAIVQKHKGEIFVDEKNSHTSFVIRLPRMQGG